MESQCHDEQQARSTKTDNGNATSACDNHNKRDDYGDRGDGNHAERNIL